MKKLPISILALLSFYVGSLLFAADGSHIYTSKWRNGYSFTDQEWTHPYNQYGYMDGLVDGLKYAKLLPETVSRLGSFDGVKQYYVDNPDKRLRPIVKVLLEISDSKIVNTVLGDQASRDAAGVPPYTYTTVGSDSGIVAPLDKK